MYFCNTFVSQWVPFGEQAWFPEYCYATRMKKWKRCFRLCLFRTRNWILLVRTLFWKKGCRQSAKFWIFRSRDVRCSPGIRFARVFDVRTHSRIIGQQNYWGMYGFTSTFLHRRGVIWSQDMHTHELRIHFAVTGFFLLTDWKETLSIPFLQTKITWLGNQ